MCIGKSSVQQMTWEWCHVAWGHCDGTEGIMWWPLIGSPASRNASGSLMVFPNLGYKKVTFLEPSLVSNIFSLSPNKPKANIPLILLLPCPPTTATTMHLSHLWALVIMVPCLGLLFLLGLLVLTLWTNWVDRHELSMRGERWSTMFSSQGGVIESVVPMVVIHHKVIFEKGLIQSLMRWVKGFELVGDLPKLITDC